MAAFVLLFSFLDVLAARKDPAGLSGEVLIDGAPQPPNFKCLSGYVVQVGTRIWSNRFKEALIPHLLALSPHQIFLPKDNLYDNFAHNNKGRGATRKKIWPAEILIMILKCSLGPPVSAMRAHGQGWQGQETLYKPHTSGSQDDSGYRDKVVGFGINSGWAQKSIGTCPSHRRSMLRV